MKKDTSLYKSDEEPFIAGDCPQQTIHKRLYKIRGIAIFFCRQGKGLMTIDLKSYPLSENTIVICFNSIVDVTEQSGDFLLSYFICSPGMFRETAFRMDTRFFHFLKNHPHYVMPESTTNSIKGLLKASVAVYADRENHFRYQIARNMLHNFLLDTCDKVYRWYSRQEIESTNRQTELFRKFIDLVHTHSPLQREVTFYADTLCISTKYLTDICRSITGEPAKTIIDNFAILEIKLLLESSDILLQDIADQLNFPDQSYLGRFFKRHMGISPVEYRNQHAQL